MGRAPVVGVGADRAPPAFAAVVARRSSLVGRRSRSVAPFFDALGRSAPGDDAVVDEMLRAILAGRGT